MPDKLNALSALARARETGGYAAVKSSLPNSMRFFYEWDGVIFVLAGGSNDATVLATADLFNPDGTEREWEVVDRLE